MLSRENMENLDRAVVFATNEYQRTQHSKSAEHEAWLDHLQVFAHRGDMFLNTKGKKEVEGNMDCGWPHRTRDLNFPSSTIACIVGDPSGVCVLDFDDPDIYTEVVSEYTDRCWPTVKTQRGFHVYFEYTGETKEAFRSLPKAIGKLDLKSSGQMWFPGCRVKQQDGSYFQYEWVPHLCNTRAGVGVLGQMPGDMIDKLKTISA